MVHKTMRVQSFVQGNFLFPSKQYFVIVCEKKWRVAELSMNCLSIFPKNLSKKWPTVKIS